MNDNSIQMQTQFGIVYLDISDKHILVNNCIEYDSISKVHRLYYKNIPFIVQLRYRKTDDDRWVKYGFPTIIGGNHNWWQKKLTSNDEQLISDVITATLNLWVVNNPHLVHDGRIKGIKSAIHECEIQKAFSQNHITKLQTDINKLNIQLAELENGTYTT